MVKRLVAAIAFAVLSIAYAGLSSAQPGSAPAPKPVRVISFDGGWNLPVWAAQRQGFFEANGVAVQIAYTPNSGFLVASLLEGRHDLALALIDNLVAYQEGQGEAKIPDNPDLFAFMGSDSGFLSVRGGKRHQDLRRPQGQEAFGRRDDDRCAFVLRELLARNGMPSAT